MDLSSRAIVTLPYSHLVVVTDLPFSTCLALERTLDGDDTEPHKKSLYKFLKVDNLKGGIDFKDRLKKLKNPGVGVTRL